MSERNANVETEDYLGGPIPLGTNGGESQDPITRFKIFDEAGMLVAVHCRIGTGSGKTVWWERPDGERNLNGRAVSSLPFYGSQFLAWKVGVQGIVITEGEKSAQALLDLDIPALGTVTGSASCPDLAVVKRTVAVLPPGVPVILWPDASDDGRAHMQKVAGRFRDAGLQNIRLVTWSDAPPKGDAFDYVQGRTAETVRTFLAEAPSTGFEPDPEGAVTLRAEPEARRTPVTPWLRVWDGSAFVKAVPRFEYLWDKSLAYGASTAITGARGRGKTYLLLGLAEALVLDRPTYLDRPIRRRTGRALLLLSDDAAELIGARITALQMAVPGRLFVASANDWGGDPLAVLGLLTSHVERLGGVDLIGVDAKYVFIPAEAGAGNDAGLTNRLVEVLRTTATRTKAGLWLNDHDSKAGVEMSGSGVIQHEMLAIFHLKKVGEADDATSPDAILETVKQKALARPLWPPTVRITQSQASTWTVLGTERDLAAQAPVDDLEPVILAILDMAKTPRTLEQIAKKAKRRLKDVRAVLMSLWSRDLVARTGAGAKGAPFKYGKRNGGPE